MIFDHHIYTCRPGMAHKTMALYEEHGYAAQSRHLGEPVLYGVTETGPINTYIHVWAYEDAADRARKRAALQADPDWQIYIERIREAGYLVSQENRILEAVPFFKPKR